MAPLIPIENIEKRILFLRGQRIMLDADLAVVYGTSTKALNQAVKRNQERFPSDFMFCLTEEEKEEVVTNCDHLEYLKYSPSPPKAFTEHGAIMLANVLKSPRAVKASIQVVRAFVKIRKMILDHSALAGKLTLLEKKYDKQFKVVFDAIRELMAPRTSESRHIGFRSG